MTFAKHSSLSCNWLERVKIFLDDNASILGFHSSSLDDLLRLHRWDERMSLLINPFPSLDWIIRHWESPFADRVEKRKERSNSPSFSLIVQRSNSICSLVMSSEFFYFAPYFSLEYVKRQSISANVNIPFLLDPIPAMKRIIHVPTDSLFSPKISFCERDRLKCSFRLKSVSLFSSTGTSSMKCLLQRSSSPVSMWHANHKEKKTTLNETKTFFVTEWNWWW